MQGGTGSDQIKSKDIHRGLEVGSLLKEITGTKQNRRKQKKKTWNM